MSAARDRPMTAEEFAVAARAYDECELWDGIMLIGEPSRWPAGLPEARLIARLDQHARAHGLGIVCGASQGYWVSRAPDRVLAADVSFLAKEGVARLAPDRWVEEAPDFVAEIRSSRDRWPNVLKKCGIWIAHGTSTVWAVDPTERRVVAFHGPVEVSEHGPGDEVDGSPALPDFRVRVDALFEGL